MVASVRRGGGERRAALCSDQGKHADAERIGREVLAARRRALGDEHPSTLMTAGNLAASLSNQGKDADAERIGREVCLLQGGGYSVRSIPTR